MPPGRLQKRVRRPPPPWPITVPPPSPLSSTFPFPLQAEGRLMQRRSRQVREEAFQAIHTAAAAAAVTADNQALAKVPLDFWGDGEEEAEGRQDEVCPITDTAASEYQLARGGSSSFTGSYDSRYDSINDHGAAAAATAVAATAATTAVTAGLMSPPGSPVWAVPSSNYVAASPAVGFATADVKFEEEEEEGEVNGLGSEENDDSKEWNEAGHDSYSAPPFLAGHPPDLDILQALFLAADQSSDPTLAQHLNEILRQSVPPPFSFSASLNGPFSFALPPSFAPLPGPSFASPMPLPLPLLPPSMVPVDRPGTPMPPPDPSAPIQMMGMMDSHGLGMGSGSGSTFGFGFGFGTPHGAFGLDGDGGDGGGPLPDHNSYTCQREDCDCERWV